MADPLAYGVAITGVTPGATTSIQVPGHGRTTGDKVSVIGARGIWKNGADSLYYANNYTATVVNPNNLTIPLDT